MLTSTLNTYSNDMQFFVCSFLLLKKKKYSWKKTLSITFFFPSSFSIHTFFVPSRLSPTSEQSGALSDATQMGDKQV